MNNEKLTEELNRLKDNPLPRGVTTCPILRANSAKLYNILNMNQYSRVTPTNETPRLLPLVVPYDDKTIQIGTTIIPVVCVS